VAFRLGSWKGAVDPDHFNEWRAGLPKRNSEALREVLVLLGLVVPDTYTPEGSATATVGKVPLSELKPYPGNPNEGDIGLIATLLKMHGQTRPIIVSTRTNHILAGNHVARAAESLGWTHIGVAWVDVDSDGEKRIVLADNRTAQLSSYDLQDLGNLIASVGASKIEGTGYTLADLDDIILGRSPHLNGYYTRSEMPFRIGALQTKVKTALVTDLNLTRGMELAELGAILGLDPQKIAQEQ
jgi:ParB-like chromosome segregation protein Spo0J